MEHTEFGCLWAATNKDHSGGWLAVAGTIHHYQEKARNLRLLLWERRRGLGVGVRHFSFSENSSWNRYLSLLTLGADGEPAGFGCLVAAETRKNRTTCCCTTRELRVTQVDTRGSKRLRGPEKETSMPL